MKGHNVWQGCGTALVTPFDINGAVDYDAYRKLVERQVSAGVDFLVPLGTTAETPNLTDDEKVRLLEITREAAAGKPILCGAGSNSTAATIRNMELLGKHGADAFLVVAPYYNKPVQKGMYAHFKAVSESTDKPVVLYNVPGRTGANISAATQLALAELPGIVAVKEASGNYAQISEVIANAPDGFSVLSGNDDETLSLMATGAHGVISVASNIAPELMKALTMAMAACRLEEARMIHYRLMPLFKNCFVESNPIPVKAGLKLLGLIDNNMRLPLTRAEESTEALMKETLRGLGMI